LRHVDAARVIRFLSRLFRRDAAPPALANEGGTKPTERAELPPKTEESVKTNVTAGVLRDAELSLRLLGSIKSNRRKD
jgi:hypothetical protein